MNGIIRFDSNSTFRAGNCISYSRFFMVSFIYIVFFFTYSKAYSCTTKQTRFLMTIYTSTICNGFICTKFYLTTSRNIYCMFTYNLSRLTCYILSTCNLYIFTTYSRACYNCSSCIIHRIGTFTFNQAFLFIYIHMINCTIGLRCM